MEDASASLFQRQLESRARNRDIVPDPVLSVDELRFVQLKADFFTEFLRQTRQLTSAVGKKLIMVVSGTIADPVAANWMYVDADTIAREQVTDELMVMAGAAADLTHWRVLADGKMKVSTWAGVHAETYPDCSRKVQTQFKAMLENPTTAGSTFHELANFIHSRPTAPRNGLSRVDSKHRMAVRSVDPVCTS